MDWQFLGLNGIIYWFGKVHALDVFSTLREIGFDGVISVCVFGWHEDADAINRRMLQRLEQEFATA